ncbi:MAG: response regulator, partial [Vulcanimicrobiota bacterium]
MLSVLLLEDDEGMRDALEEVLLDEGYQVTAVGCAMDAVARARQQPFDLVIADIRMDGPDGLEALAEVKGFQPGVHSLVVTGYSTEADSIRAIRLGVEDYLKKPFQANEFRAALARIVERCRSDRERQAQNLAVQRALYWALESLVRNMELAGGPPGLLRAADLLEGLLESQLDLMDRKMAFLLAGLERAGFIPPQPLMESLPPKTLELTRQPSPTLAEAFTLLLAAWQREFQRDEETRSPLALRLDSLLSEPGQSSPENQPSQASLLSLARCWEEAGQLEESRQLYSEVASAETALPHQIEAQLGIARVEARQGRRAQSSESALTALALAEQLGPRSLAMTGLDVGILLMQAQHPKAQTVLRQAVPNLDLEGSRALAGFALSWLEGQADHECLKLLCRQGNQSQFCEAGAWVAPLLFSLEAEDASVLKAQQTLLRLAPTQVGLFALSPAQPKSSKLRALHRIQESGHPIKEKLREHLVQNPDPDLQAALSGAAEPAASQPPELRLLSLGPFEVLVEGRRLEERQFRSQKIRFLLACLDSHEKSVHEEVLLEVFWPDDPPSKAKQHLYTATSVLRRCLRPSSWPHELEYVTRSQGMLCLNRELPIYSELNNLRQVLRDASLAREQESELSRLRQVFALDRNSYLDGCYMDWALLLRQKLEDDVICR